jgi:V/A-type H+-transporting ATPase subunit B
MAAIVGESGLAEAESRALRFAGEFEQRFLAQGAVRRSIAETRELGWSLLEELPREDLTRLSDRAWQARQRQEGKEGG